MLASVSAAPIQSAPKIVWGVLSWTLKWLKKKKALKKKWFIFHLKEVWRDKRSHIRERTLRPTLSLFLCVMTCLHYQLWPLVH